MAASNGYLLFPQVEDETTPLLVAHTPTSWWVTQKARAADLIAKNAGLLLVICSQFLFASMSFSVKLLGKLDPPTPTLELITIRMAITLCCCMVYMLANKIQDPFLGPKGVRGLLVIRGIVGFFGLFGVYYALNYLSLADATVITYLAPFTVAIAAHLLLGETYTKKDALAGVCSLLGVVLIARPTFLFGGTFEGDDDDITSFQRLRAVGVALIGVCGATAAYITVRAIGTRAHPMHLMTFFALCCVIVGPSAMAMTHEPTVFPMTWEWITLVSIIGVLGFGAQILLTVGLRYETVTRSALGLYSQLLFAVILELVVFGTVPSLMSTGGATIIVAAQAFALLSKQETSNKPSVAQSPRSPDDVEENTSFGQRVTTQDAALPPRVPDIQEEV